MAVGMIELQGTITRAQDFQTIQHNEDAKGMVDYSNQMVQGERKVIGQMNQVHKKEDAAKNSNADANQKNAYQGDGGKQRRKETPTDGKVIHKSGSSFDIRI